MLVMSNETRGIEMAAILIADTQTRLTLTSPGDHPLMAGNTWV
jgi:hypothetical protein